jgi:hypothetical protein
MLYDVLNGLYHMKLMGVSHGLVSPDFVARTTTGYAVLDDPLHDCFGVIKLDRYFKENRLRGVYLSPEAFKAALRKNRSDQCFNIEKADVFSFGMVILEAALLTKLDAIYESPNPQTGIDVNGLDHYIAAMQERYPENNLLTSTVLKMLEIDPEDRPDLKELFEKLPDYEMVKSYFSENPSEMGEREKESMKASMHGTEGRVSSEPQDWANKIPETAEVKEYNSPKKQGNFEKIEQPQIDRSEEANIEPEVAQSNVYNKNPYEESIGQNDTVKEDGAGSHPVMMGRHSPEEMRKLARVVQANQKSSMKESSGELEQKVEVTAYDQNSQAGRKTEVCSPQFGADVVSKKSGIIEEMNESRNIVVRARKSNRDIIEQKFKSWKKKQGASKGVEENELKKNSFHPDPYYLQTHHENSKESMKKKMSQEKKALDPRENLVPQVQYKNGVDVDRSRRISTTVAHNTIETRGKPVRIHGGASSRSPIQAQARQPSQDLVIRTNTINGSRVQLSGAKRKPSGHLATPQNNQRYEPKRLSVNVNVTPSRVPRSTTGGVSPGADCLPQVSHKLIH